MDMDLAGDSPAGGGGPHAERFPSSSRCACVPSTARQDDVRDAIEVYLEDLGSVICAGRSPCRAPRTTHASAHVESARVTDIGTWACEYPRLPRPAPAAPRARPAIPEISAHRAVGTRVGMRARPR